MGNYLDGDDAAFPQNLYGSTGIILGYFGGPDAYNIWEPSAWRHFIDNYKIPMWVGGLNGANDAAQAVTALRSLGVPAGKVTLLDIEDRKDITYVEHYGKGLQAAGYKVWVYGSISNLFRNPKLNGYAVADPTGVRHMYPHDSVRMTQWAFGANVDNDVIKRWLVQQDDLWK
jgi:hypothetical protein